MTQFQGQFCSSFLPVIWMQDCNASSAVLLMILNWEVLTPRRDKSMKRCLVRLEQWVISKGLKLNKKSVVFCAWDSVMPDTETDWEMSGSRMAQQKGI